jgi:proprotein convertase subtilisin/kexin type 5
LSTFLYFYQCLSQCPNGFYPNDNDQTCDPCYMSCATCTGPFNNGSCLTCNSKLVLNDGTCQPSGTCPLNKWQNGSVCTLCNQTCKSCLGAGGQNCSSCNNETYLLSGQCLTQCPPALVAVSDVWKCLKICDYTCSDCFGPKDDQCNLCPSTRFLVQSDSNSINSSSVCTCNSRFFSQDPGLKNATCLGIVC